MTAAVAALDRAATLAAPGWVRAGVPRRRGPDDGVDDVGLEPNRGPPRNLRELAAAANPRPGRATLRPAASLEPLSERELDVLRLLGSDLDGPEIARELGVTLNTLRTHSRNVYAKLGVQQPARRGSPGGRARPGPTPSEARSASSLAHPRPRPAGNSDRVGERREITIRPHHVEVMRAHHVRFHRACPGTSGRCDPRPGSAPAHARGAP